MPFLTPDPHVESWLRDAATDFRPFSQKEYRTFVADWRSRFEAALMNGDRLVGKVARHAALERLPIDGAVFSLPGYRWLPAATNARLDRAFGYWVTELATIDFDTANRADALIVDRALTHTCLCTHEAGVMTYEEFCEVR